jgi:DNA repair protein RecN (Recombination protein N)
VDDAEFMISTNPGEPLRPLMRIASGGELSRIMLAIKTVLADKDDIDTVIFDEIDVGISGRTAQKVSEKMMLIGRTRQVICITHLAQIAAMADSHYRIEKQVQSGETQTQIRRMDEGESVEELARILGGAEITDAVLKNAEEMKRLAETKKCQARTAHIS